LTRGTSGTPTTVPAGATSLSLSLAPAPTQTFYWATVNVSAPGFAGDGTDVLTISLDGSGNLHYLSFKTLPMIFKTFGDGVDEYPLSGTKHVEPGPSAGFAVDVTVLENPPPTSNHFLLSYHVVNTQEDYDYIESTEGNLSGAGWAVTYSQVGTFDGVAMNANASGTLYAGDPSVTAPDAGQPATWSAPAELVAPGFYGPPADHMTVATDGTGQIQAMQFERFPVLPRTYGSGASDWPLSGTATVGERTITVDLSSLQAPDHFALQYHVKSTSLDDDYEEGIDGTRMGAGLVVRYFIQGSLEGASIEAHAAGTLAPAAP
jgi:hypothetical protein